MENYSIWDFYGFEEETIDGVTVLVGKGGVLNEIISKFAVSDTYLEFDALVKSVNSTVDGNVGAIYRTTDDHKLFFEYNTVSKFAQVRLFANGAATVIGGPVKYEMENARWYHFKVALEENNLLFYIDNQLIISIDNSYGENLHSGAWCVQGYNSLINLKNVKTYNTQESAFSQWNTDGWEIITEDDCHFLVGGRKIVSKKSTCLNSIALSACACDTGNDSSLEIAFKADSGVIYSVEYSYADEKLSLLRIAGEEKTIEKSVVLPLPEGGEDFCIVINDSEIRVVSGEGIVLESSDTHCDVLATGVWEIMANNITAKISGLVFFNILPENRICVKDCDLEFNSKESVEIFTANVGSVSHEGSNLIYTLQGSGSYLESPSIEAPVGTEYSAKLAVKNTILLRMKNETDTELFKIYYKTDRALRYSEENSVSVTVKKSCGFQTVFANLSRCADHAGYLRGFRIVPVGATKGTIEIDAITFEREKALYDYAGRIISCIADAGHGTVTIKGVLNDAYENAQVNIYEIYVANWRERVDGLTPSVQTSAKGRDFTAVLPLKNGKITRLSSLFVATVVTQNGEVKISDRFMVENYRDFSQNPYAFVLPELTVNVTDAPFGAKGDGFTNDNNAIQKAIDYVHAQGGGAVVLEGDESFYGRRYVATRLQLWDNVELRICKGAILWQSPREKDYDYDVVRGHDITFPGINWAHTFLCHNYPLIFASKCKNVRVTGGGIIRMNDAGGENLDGVDGATIWTGCECRMHVMPLAFFRCVGVEISDITVMRANSYLANMTGTQNAYLANITGKETTCASGDGIGLGSAKHILVDRFTIFSNDDAITLSSAYNDPRGLRWWHATPGENNSAEDIVIKSSHICSGHGITFITWGTDAPDLSKQQIRNIEVYDCILGGPYAVGTWPDNPYYGKKPFDNSETDDFSPVVGVRIHDNVYRSPATLECITATDVITDCGIVSHNNFVHGDFERRNGQEGWIAGLSNWSYTMGEDSVVEAVDVNGDHKGRIAGTGSLYQGLHLDKGGHIFRIDTNLVCGGGNIFVRDAIRGKLLADIPLPAGDKPQNEIGFTLDEPADLELGVQLNVAGEVFIDNASVTPAAT